MLNGNGTPQLADYICPELRTEAVKKTSKALFKDYPAIDDKKTLHRLFTLDVNENVKFETKYKFKIIELTPEEITTLTDLDGQVIAFKPHNDFESAYNSAVNIIIKQTALGDWFAEVEVECISGDISEKTILELIQPIGGEYILAPRWLELIQPSGGEYIKIGE